MKTLTSQNAPLEGFLAWLRASRVEVNLTGKTVLHFGCGARFNALRMIAKKAKSRTALDTIFDADETFSSYDGIHGFGSLKIMADEVYKGRLEPFDCILALACFEHIEREEYKTIPLGQEQSH